MTLLHDDGPTAVPCSAEVRFFWFTEETELCGNPPVAYVEGGCVHEHVMRRWLCSDHYSRDVLVCRACEEAACMGCPISFSALQEAAP